MDRGTLYQLKNLLCRTSIPNDPDQNMKGCEDFLYIILCSHIVAAADEIENSCDETLTIKIISGLIVDKYVNFLSDKNHGIIGDEDDEEVKEDDEDGDEVHSYASEVLSLALIWHSYHDAVKEGDGERVMMIWKYLLIIFSRTGRTNYTKEVLIQLLQNNYLFSERKLKWDRFVNTQGKAGCNVPGDLHMEHLNKRFKGVLRNLGSNIQPHSIVRASKAIGVVHSVSSALESELMPSKRESSKHATPSMVKDIETVVTVLKEVGIFDKIKNRKHASLKFQKGVLTSIDRENVATRLLEKALNAVVLL